jgi:hypothetical protein
VKKFQFIGLIIAMFFLGFLGSSVNFLTYVKSKLTFLNYHPSSHNMRRCRCRIETPTLSLPHLLKARAQRHPKKPKLYIGKTFITDLGMISSSSNTYALLIVANWRIRSIHAARDWLLSQGLVSMFFINNLSQPSS